MSVINIILGIPLGYLCYLCYKLTGSYGLAIIVFTLLTKILLFPISLISQKNSIKMVKIQPQLEDIKERYSDNNALFFAEQKKLFKQENYSTFLNILPLLLQIPIILGVLNVIYNPLQHIIRLDGNIISALIAKTSELTGIAELGYGGELRVLDAVAANSGAFMSVAGADVITKIRSLDLMYLGMNLAALPSLSSILVIIPILSGVSALALCISQNKYYVLQMEQSALSQWGVTIFLVAFSTYFAFIVPVGIGIYWIAGNLLSIVVLIICNMIYDPKKYIDYENRSQKTRLTKEERDELSAIKKKQRAREKEDNKKFFSQDKQLVFYSESNGFYKYFAGIIDYVTNNSDLTVHYVTSDINDNIFKTTNPQIKPYYIGGNALIPFMMKMDADMVIMTMPDLEKYHIKRSLVKKDVEYVYLDHGMTSYHMMLREGALDHFDTIFCYGPNHIEEVRATEEVYGLKEKKLVKTGFCLLDKLLCDYEAMEKKKNDRKQILIAPSWQKDCIMDICLDEILDQLLGKGYCVIVRPHPEYVKRFQSKMKRIADKYKNWLSDDFILETDFSSNRTVYSSDLIITDWSSIAQEFSYATKKPSLFINTPVKIMNPEYKKIGLVPLDISLRDQIGVSVDMDKLDGLYDKVNHLIEHTNEYHDKITQVLNKNIFNIGHAAEAAGEYIIEELSKKRNTEPQQPEHSK